jgi:hypothetical protein
MTHKKDVNLTFLTLISPNLDASLQTITNTIVKAFYSQQTTDLCIRKILTYSVRVNIFYQKSQF